MATKNVEKCYFVNARGKKLEFKNFALAKKKWNLLDPLMVISTENSSVKSIFCCKNLREEILNSTKKKNEISIFILFILVVVLSLICLTLGNAKSPYILLLAVFFWGFSITDFCTGNFEKKVIERSNFAYFIRVNFLKLAYIPALSLVMGIFQLILLQTESSMEKFLLEYGALSFNLNEGHWWGYVIGPFFHSSYIHFFGNLAFLLILGPIASYISRWKALSCFILGVHLSSFSALAFSSIDAITGVSGGVFSLLGLLVYLSLTKKNFFPQNSHLIFLSITIMNMGASFILNENSSAVAHVTGFLTGLVFGILLKYSDIDRKNFSWQFESDPVQGSARVKSIH